MMYKILIIEDDPQISESLTEILEILNHRVVGVADSYADAVKALYENDAQLALIDIQLKGEKSGIDVAEKIRNDFKIPFIFTTAYADQETIKKASQHSPYGYIVKPYGMKDINAGIEIAMSNHQNIEQMKEGDEGIFNSESLFIKSNSRIIRVNIDEILFVEAKGDYSVFKTENKGYVVNSTFKNVEKKLTGSQFIKVHRSYIVNVEKIVDIEENSLLINDRLIPVSRGQKPHLMKKLNLI